MCKVQGIGILSLTEIWHPEVSQLKFLHNWTWNMSIRANREGGGAATIVNPKIKSHPREELNNPQLEAVWCEIYVENTKILLGSVYIPPGMEDEMSLLINTLDTISSNENIIVMGDFNAKHPMWYNTESNKLGEQLSTFLTTSNYIITNNDMHTYNSSIIDLTLVKGCRHLVSNWSAHPEIMVNTDHTMILFDLSLKLKENKKPKWNIKKADWEEWKKATKESFNEIMHNISQRQHPDINKDYIELRDSLTNLGNEHIGKTKIRSNSKPWWNNDIESKYKEYKAAKKDMKKRSDHEKLNRLMKTRQDFLNAYQEARKTHLEETVKSLEGDDKGMWKAIKRFNNSVEEYAVQPLVNNDGKFLTEDKEIAEEFVKQHSETGIEIEDERKKEVQARAEQILRECETEGIDDVINKTITIDEIKESFAKLRDETGYSPLEDIDSCMLKNSDDSIYDLFHYMYNSWLDQGELPNETKIDYKRLHRKPNKETYNRSKTYRPITLDGLISKSFLRIMRERVDWKLEIGNALSFTQEAYRKDRSANDILIRLVQFVQEAWNKGETVVLAIIDYDSFFENIWHDLALIKLHDLGIRGKTLRILYSYLKNRKFCFEVNGYVSELRDSKIGTPQGGIPSTTFANAYTHDSDLSSFEQHAEFSDDNLKWESHVDENKAIDKLQERLDQYVIWCKNNNVKLSAEKCKLMIFRPKSSPRPFSLPKVYIDNKNIEVVEEKRILGTIIDNELNFNSHFTHVEKACYSALNTIKHLYTSSYKPSLNTGTTLYKTLIRQIMDYSTVAITNIDDKQLRKMESIQHKCLRLFTQTLASTSKEVLNLTTNILPIDLHFKLRASESLARIMSKNSPINSSYESWRSSNLRNNKAKIITTYRKLELASQQILQKNLNQHEVLKVKLHDTKFPPFLKNSGIIPSEKSKEQQKTKVVSLMMESNEYDFIIGTDGSTLKYDNNSSLGPSAAAAIVFRRGNMRHPTEVLKRSLGSISHNYEAELTGIQLALQYLHDQRISNTKVLVVCDCVPAMEATFTNKITRDYNHVTMNNKEILHDLTTHNNNIDVIWAPGHEGIQLNEIADMVAKEEAAKQIKVQRPLERKVVLTYLRQQVLINWQRRVNIELSNHQVSEINPDVNMWKIHNLKGTNHLIRLITGHHYLNSFQSKLYPLKISKNCSCGQEETLHHFLFQCQKYMRLRQKWHYKVVGIIEDTEALNNMSLATPFGQREDISEEKNRLLQESICTYIMETKRFI